MDEPQGSWLNDGLALALVLAVLVFAVPLLALLGAIVSAYYGPGAVDWKVLVGGVAVFVTVGIWFAERRWARRGGWRTVATAAVPLAVFGVIGLLLWLAPGIFGLDADSIGVAPSIIGLVGLGGLALHGVLGWIAIATGPAVSAAPSGGSAVTHAPKRPRKKAR